MKIQPYGVTVKTLFCQSDSLNLEPYNSNKDVASLEMFIMRDCRQKVKYSNLIS